MSSQIGVLVDAGAAVNLYKTHILSKRFTKPLDSFHWFHGSHTHVCGQLAVMKITYLKAELLTVPYLRYAVKPSCLQAVRASDNPKLSLQTVPHCPL